MTEALLSWALPKLAHLLPLDEQSLTDILTYSASLSKNESAEHLKNLLGDSPQALEFISSFNSRRQDVAPPPKAASQDVGSSTTAVGSRDDSDGVPNSRRRGQKKPKPSLHNAGPVRKSDDYGNVAGGYRKSTSVDDDYAAPSPKRLSHHAALSNALSFSQQPDALQAPRMTTGTSTPSPLPSRDPSPPRQKLPPSASGPLISDLPNVRAKQSKKPAHSGTSTPHKAATTTTSSISDLTSAIAALELSTNPSLSSERRKCGCHATIHPLFEPAPNCLSCGQIICALEGLQPCSFCDTPVLTPQQVQTMIRSLREERGTEKITLHNAAVSHTGTPRLGGTPDSSGDEMSTAAAKARAHRDKLLAFQRENAQRTKVHDEAADYDMTVTLGATQWMSPAQRALALKKQQKYLREMEENNKPEWEKKKTVMSMSIKGGKLVRSYDTVKETHRAEPEPEIDEVIESEATDESSNRKGAFGKNPLLAGGGLIRPVWKPAGDAKGKEKEDAERRQTWRRVQDDNDDNEQWILDGGVRGFDVEREGGG